jgi:hypothetical protein
MHEWIGLRKKGQNHFIIDGFDMELDIDTVRDINMDHIDMDIGMETNMQMDMEINMNMVKDIDVDKDNFNGHISKS